MLFIETSSDPHQEGQQREDPRAAAEKNMPQDKDIEENKAVAALSYLGILFLIPLLVKKESKFAKFHAKQGLIIAIGWFFVGFPVIGWIMWFILAVLSIMGITNVLNGKYAELPVVGDLAKKFNI